MRDKKGMQRKSKSGSACGSHWEAYYNIYILRYSNKCNWGLAPSFLFKDFNFGCSVGFLKQKGVEDVFIQGAQCRVLRPTAERRRKISSHYRIILFLPCAFALVLNLYTFQKTFRLENTEHRLYLEYYALQCIGPHYTRPTVHTKEKACSWWHLAALITVWFRTNQYK